MHIRIDKTYSIDTLKIKDDLCAFKLFTTTATRKFIDGKDKNLGEVDEEIQGFATSKNIDKFINGKDTELKIEKRFILVTKECLEYFRKTIWSTSSKNITDFILKNPFDELSLNPDVGYVIEPLYDSHMINDINGEKLPVAMYFNYSTFRMTNANYDLEKASKILKERNDIVISYEENLYENVDSKTGIRNIPYYNQDDLNDKYIAFTWHPSVEDYRKMWKECERIGGEYPSTNRWKAIFDLDILGLRKGGATLSNSFY